MGVALIGLILVWRASFNPRVNDTNYQHLNVEMMPDDVIAILGTPHTGSSIRNNPRWEGFKSIHRCDPKDPRPKVTELEWHDGPDVFGRQMAITVGFDKDRHLTETEAWFPARKCDSMFAKMRRWIGPYIGL